MNYFENFVSATPSPNNAQSFFLTGDKDKEITSRVYAKLEAEGECTFSLLFSNILDTTPKYGSHPNALGHRLWADALGKFITEKFGIR